MNHVTQYLSSADISTFSSEISIGTLLPNLLTFLINMVKILMMSAKLATPGLLKIKMFKTKYLEITIVDYDLTKKKLSRDSNYTVDVGM